MDTLIEQLKEKIKMCGDATREGRARKGGYVDALQMARQAVVVKPTLSEVLAELEPMIFDYVESHNEDNVRQYLRGVLGKYFA